MSQCGNQLQAVQQVVNIITLTSIHILKALGPAGVGRAARVGSSHDDESDPEFACGEDSQTTPASRRLWPSCVSSAWLLEGRLNHPLGTQSPLSLGWSLPRPPT